MKITQTKDYETIARLCKTVQDIHVSLYPETFKPYQFEPIRDFFKNIIDNPKFIFLMAEIEEKKVGYVMIEILESPGSAFKKPYKTLYIHQISVEQDYEKQGIGSKLIDYIEKLAKKMDATKIELDYWTDNRNAKTFYQKVGFVMKREVVQKDIN